MGSIIIASGIAQMVVQCLTQSGLVLGW